MALNALVQTAPAASVTINPIITVVSQVVLVKKSYTNPARKAVTLRTSGRFPRTGTLTRSSNAVRLFTAARGGTEIIFDGTDNVFPGARLRSGVRLFAEGASPSAALNDVQLTLTLTPGPTPVGPPATATFTAVALTLDIAVVRTASGVDLDVLSQPPDPAPAPGTATDKWFGGRLVNVQDAANTQERAMLIVRQVQPAAFAGDLVLRQVQVTGNNIGGLATRAQLFDNEQPTSGETARRNPLEFGAGTVPATGRRFFVQGRVSSSALRDIGFQLGIKGVDNDGDRVAVTVGVTPFVILAASTVVVKKSYTNPARMRVTLRASAPFNRNGTLTRSSSAVRLFTAARGGTEITFNGTDNVFTGARLTAGVQLFAEGVSPSAALNDVQLTLTLADGATPPSGMPTTARLTAVELTLDVCVPRTSPGVDPPPLSVGDKINPGRFVQVRVPNSSHLRAMLIVRPPNPAAFAGTLVLAPINQRVQAFNAEQPASGQTALPNAHPIASGIIPPGGAQFFVEGRAVSTAVRDTGFRLGIQGLENEGDRVVLTTVQLEVIEMATAAAPAVTFVRVGLWDHAFDPATGALGNDVLESRNFIGADSRHFFLRVRDPSASSEVPIQWRTTFGDNTNDDARPAAQTLSLLETGTNSHVFLSKALFLVTDDVDKAQATNSGLPAGHVDAGDRTQTQSNHRLRCITVDNTRQLDSKVDADYTPSGGAAPIATVSNFVFNRAPEERRRMRIHLVNVRDAVGGTGALTTARRDLVIDTFRSIYAVCGIFADVDEIMLDPPASCIGWPTLYPTDPIATDPAVEGFTFTGGNLVASASQNDIITAVRALPTFDANDIYIICVARVYSAPVPAPPGPGLVSGGGEAFPDAWTAAGSTARSFAFVGVASGITEFAEVHEATHITTNLRNVAGGHFDLGSATATGPGNIDGKNLMHRFFLTNASGVSNPKRLWNDRFTNRNRTPRLVIPRQIDAIRASRFVRPF